MLAQGGGIGVPFGTARNLAAVRFVHGMGPGVLEPVGRVGVSFVAAFDGADVWPFARVRTGVNLEVFRSAEAFVTLETVVWFLVRVRSDVNQHLIPRQRKEVGEIRLKTVSNSTGGRRRRRRRKRKKEKAFYLALKPRSPLAHPSQPQ